MNKTKIEWCDATWNPVTGCLHGCEYCYAARIAHRFGLGWDVFYDEKIFVLNEPSKSRRSEHKPKRIEPFPYGFAPTFHRYRLDEPQHWKKPRTIFVCSMADLFGEWVPDEWIEAVVEATMQATQHRYLFLTKNPARYGQVLRSPSWRYVLPRGASFWYGATATTEEKAIEASNEIDSLPYGYKKFLSIEPICGPLRVNEWDWISSFDWVIIGAETGNRSGKIVPEKSWINYIVASCAARGVPVFMKDSLIPIVGEENMRREFPW